MCAKYYIYYQVLCLAGSDIEVIYVNSPIAWQRIDQLCNSPYELPRRIKGLILGRGLFPFLFHTLNIKTVDTIKKNYAAGQKKQYGPRLAGEILHDYLENSNEPLAVAYREHTTESEEQGWNPNTHLCVDLKTQLRSDRIAKVGKSYTGVLRRDIECDEFRCDDRFVFTETVPPTAGKRNPHVFDGFYITATRRDDGSLRLNFKELKVGADFSLERFALGVYNELCLALGGLVEE